MSYFIRLINVESFKETIDLHNNIRILSILVV
jgi:hypothetical protein